MDTPDTVDPRARRTRERAVGAARALLLSEGVDAVTHQRVAEHAGVGRRTMYRHWPDRDALLAETLAMTSAPRSAPGADLRTALVEHLQALSAALHHGPLTFVLATLNERRHHDPVYTRLRDELVASGCAPLRALLDAAAGTTLPPDLDVDTAVAVLEGPVLHSAMLGSAPLPPDAVAHVVDRFLELPPAAAGGVQPAATSGAAPAFSNTQPSRGTSSAASSSPNGVSE